MSQKAKNVHIIAVSALVFIVLLLTALIINLVRLSRETDRIRALELKIAELNRQIDENEDEIELKESNAYIERRARELYMKGRDEYVFKAKKDKTND